MRRLCCVNNILPAQDSQDSEGQCLVCQSNIHQMMTESSDLELYKSIFNVMLRMEVG